MKLARLCVLGACVFLSLASAQQQGPPPGTYQPGYAQPYGQQPGYPPPQGYEQQPGYAGQPPPPAPQQGGWSAYPEQGGGSCDAGCRHYLQCRNALGPDTLQQCLAACAQQGYPPDVLAQFVTLPCDQAIAFVEQQNGGGGGQTGAGAGAGGVGPGHKDCQGCKKWDNLCQYVVETAVSSGPYSGMVTDCDPRCCP